MLPTPLRGLRFYARQILKESVKFKNVYVRPSHTAAERTHICGLYVIPTFCMEFNMHVREINAELLSLEFKSLTTAKRISREFDNLYY